MCQTVFFYPDQDRHLVGPFWVLSICEGLSTDDASRQGVKFIFKLNLCCRQCNLKEEFQKCH